MPVYGTCGESIGWDMKVGDDLRHSGNANVAPTINMLTNCNDNCTFSAVMPRCKLLTEHLVLSMIVTMEVAI